MIERDIDINIEWRINKCLNKYFEEYLINNNTPILNRIIFTDYTHPDNCMLFVKILICKNCNYTTKITFIHKKVFFKDIIYQLNNHINNINKCFCNNRLENYISNYFHLEYLRSHHGIYIK